MKRLIKLIIFGIILTFFFSINVSAMDEIPVVDGYKPIFTSIKYKDDDITIDHTVIAYLKSDWPCGLITATGDGTYAVYFVSPIDNTKGYIANTTYSSGNTNTVFGGGVNAVIGFVAKDHTVRTSLVPLFKTQASLDYYVANGKVQNVENVILPDGYKIDEDGTIGKMPVLESIGVPLEFKHFIPGMYAQSPNKMLVIKNNLHDFYAEWKNKDDSLGYHVEVQYKGKYKGKKNIFSKQVEVDSDWHTIGDVKMEMKLFKKDEMYIDMGVNSPIYLDISSKLGFTPSTTTLEQIEGSMRVRYIKYKDDRPFSYGKWVESRINSDGAFSYVTDEDGNKEDSQEYGGGMDYTDDDLSDDSMGTIKKDVASTYENVNGLVSYIGQIPNAISSIFSYLPSDIFKLIALSFSLLFAVGILKTIL